MQTDKGFLAQKYYTSNSNYSLLQIIKSSLNGYKQSFYLAKQLATRDIKAQYRQSLLGIFWALSPVIMSAAVWIFLQGTGTIKLSSTNIPYPLYVVIGTTFWSVLVDCLLMPTDIINSNKSIITKVNFQKEALITTGIIKLFFNLIIKLGLVIILLIIFKQTPSASVIFFIPLLLFVLTLFISLGIIISPFGVLYSDISRGITVVMQLLMYFTPVVYALPKSGFLKLVMMYNPLSYIIVNVRNSLTGGDVSLWFIIVLAGISFFLSFIAMIIYRISMPIITERMSA
jgi:lipopolysaccharide transport system permease protein